MFYPRTIWAQIGHRGLFSVFLSTFFIIYSHQIDPIGSRRVSVVPLAVIRTSFSHEGKKKDTKEERADAPARSAGRGRPRGLSEERVQIRDYLRQRDSIYMPV